MAQQRILICDDDPVILRLLQVNLELEGYEVLLAHDGEEAFKQASDQVPDLVILDIMMPRMDGYQAVEALKGNHATAGIPVVFLSAKAQQSDIDRGLDHGVSDYLTKPFDPGELLEVVQRLIG
ncbi:MAG: response regulator [Actinomycetota bacterium]|nr:response regulator [Actinomycetota bacterium]